MPAAGGGSPSTLVASSPPRDLPREGGWRWGRLWHRTFCSANTQDWREGGKESWWQRWGSAHLPATVIRAIGGLVTSSPLECGKAAEGARRGQGWEGATGGRGAWVQKEAQGGPRGRRLSCSWMREGLCGDEVGAPVGEVRNGAADGWRPPALRPSGKVPCGNRELAPATSRGSAVPSRRTHARAKLAPYHSWLDFPSLQPAPSRYLLPFLRAEFSTGGGFAPRGHCAASGAISHGRGRCGGGRAVHLQCQKR